MQTIYQQVFFFVCCLHFDHFLMVVFKHLFKCSLEEKDSDKVIEYLFIFQSYFLLKREQNY